ncbi:hypothetical protein [Cutibacterium sp.]|uniref:hypothetical protein n=1 Tax=Cutibacterium sp. TaxID=1912221 RepID=UPI0026DBA2B4|nr:hypothetical protein [Cutibacterium sp.]MDO4411998.1 hypothetical protein [Cutibacterium sp.]
MTTALMKTCLLGMAGVMTIGLAACGDDSSSTSSTNATSASVSASANAGSASTSANPTYQQSAGLKRLSTDDVTNAISENKINNQTFTVVNSSQISDQTDQVLKSMDQAKVSPAKCGDIIKNATSGITDSELNNTVSALGGDQSSPVALTFITSMSDRLKKSYETENEQFSQCGKVTMELQGHKTEMTMKMSPVKGYESVAKRAGLSTTVSSSDGGPEITLHQAYVWLNNDQLIQTSSLNAKTAQTTLASAVEALGISKK